MTRRHEFRRHATRPARRIRRRRHEGRGARVEGRGRHEVADRRGSTIVVVVMLLALLSLTGVTFALFSLQWNESAQFFSDGAKEVTDDNVDPDLFMDFAMEQLLLGARDDNPQSALYGGRFAIVPTMFGRDLHPYSGRGVNVIDTGGGVPGVDQNYDGVPDPGNGYMLTLNSSHAAHFTDPDGTPNSGDELIGDRNLGRYPSPDVDHTAPGFNSAFLTFNGYGIDPNTGRRVKVVTPAFHRPMLFRGGGGFQHGWDVDPTLETQVLRPHASHRVAGGPTPRFTNAFPFSNNGGVDYDEGVWAVRSPWAPNTTYQIGDWLLPRANNAAGRFFKCTADGSGGAGGNSGADEPEWDTDAPNPGDTVVDGALTWTAFDQPVYAYDADPDGDGEKEAIWMDLGFPMLEKPGGEKYVPLFAFTVYDAEGLLNLNAHGNKNGDLDFTGGPFGGGDHLTTGNHGVSPSEVDPGYALNANVNNDLAGGDTPGGVLARHGDLFPNNTIATAPPAVSPVETANAELFMLLHGKIHRDSSGNIEDLFAGRYGDVENTIDGFSSGDRLDFPAAGRPLVDDDGTLNFRGWQPASQWSARAYQLGEWVRSSASGNTMHYVCVLPGDSATEPFSSFDEVGERVPGSPGSGDAQFMALPSPTYAFGQPYDIRGTGYWWNNGSTTPGNTPAPRFFSPLSNSTPATDLLTVNRWLQYRNYPIRTLVSGSPVPWRSPTGWGMPAFYGDPDGTGPLPTTLLHGILMDLGSTGGTPIEPVQQFYAGIDEPHEMEVDLRFIQAAGGSRFDMPFDPSDAAFLRFSESDLTNTGVSSRLRELASWNFSDNLRAAEIRKRFTPLSWDVKSYGTTTPDASGSLPFRNWEWSGGEFPPQFGTVTRYSATDPLRPAVRKLLSVEANALNGGATPSLLVQRMLSLSHLADEAQHGPGPDETMRTSDDVVVPRFRRLTEHPVDPGTTTIGTTGALNTIEQQEFDARRDRQQMARDVYVLLYLLGGAKDENYATEPNALPDPGQPPSDTNARPLYSDEQLRKMAQFAVNVVDAIDPDNVITKFEYDKDLHDGWDLDLDHNAFEDSDVDFVDRGVVYGVERQELTLSEAFVMGTKSAQGPSGAADHESTGWNDALPQSFGYVELRNVSPQPVGFNTGAWKIVAQDQLFTDSSPQDDLDDDVEAVHTRHLTLLKGEVPGGGLFTIGTAKTESTNSPIDSDPAADPPAPSNLVLPDDPSADMTTLGRYIPRAGETDPTVVDAEELDLDLIVDFTTSASDRPFRVTDGPYIHPEDAADEIAQGTLHDDADGNDVDGDGNPDGAFIALGQDPDGGSLTDDTESTTFVLLRRLHPHRTAPTTPDGQYNQDNPWVVVDRFTTKLRLFDPDDVDGDGVGQSPDDFVDTEMPRVHSYERREALAHVNRLNALPELLNDPPDATPRFKTTFGETNSGTHPGVFNAWQSHFDRDFTSVAELFSVPLYGPHELTDSVTGLLGDLTSAYDGDDTAPNATVRRLVNRRANSAGTTYFLNPRNRGLDVVEPPDPPSGPDTSLQFGQGDDGNLWARLLGFVTVPQMGEDMTSPDRFRRPGKLNWNTLRDPEVLAGLIDDPVAFDPATNDTRVAPYIDDLHEQGIRDWWLEFSAARDGVDDLSGLTIPGSPDSEPFRSLAHVDLAADGRLLLESSFLRGLPSDSGLGSVTAQRRLLEVGTSTQHTNEDVDLYSRHKLLAKALQNSTTRSNVFFVFVQVGFFEADDSSGEVRIGAEIDPGDRPRAFFVVDRSLAFEQLRGSHLRRFGGSDSFGIKHLAEGGFDFRKLILHRQLIE